MKPTFAQSIRSQLEARGPLGAALLDSTPATKKTKPQKTKPFVSAGVPRGTTYDPASVIAFWQSQGLPGAQAEFQFHEKRKWRFDLAWLDQKVAVEVQGGIWTDGRHTRGAALKLEWEKLNTAASLGWRILYCEPKDVMSSKFIGQIKLALGQD